MAKLERPITTKSDKKTRQYILDMMKDLPTELLSLVTELRDTSAIIRLKVDALDQGTQTAYEQFKEEMRGLSTRIDTLLQVIRELCSLASKGTAIRPMWDIMQEKQIDSPEKEGGSS